MLPDRLFHVLEGDILIRKGEREVKIGPRTFNDEEAFLHHTPARRLGMNSLPVKPRPAIIAWAAGISLFFSSIASCPRMKWSSWVNALRTCAAFLGS